ncbi:hypothetical protein JTB14_031962 [Gonioctena quinquepunctata]|nr:hypothetical protein JTB14_031962 [Gonioctena quinquepunctata]
MNGTSVDPREALFRSSLKQRICKTITVIQGRRSSDSIGITTHSCKAASIIKMSFERQRICDATMEHLESPSEKNWENLVVPDQTSSPPRKEEQLDHQQYERYREDTRKFGEYTVLSINGGLTLEEALQIAYNDDLDVDQIYIEPQNEGAITDEDSGEEMKADSGEDDELIEPETEHVGKVTYEDIDWINGDLVESSGNYCPSDYESFKTLNPTEMFELFIDHDVLSLLVEESNKYAQFKNLPCVQITLDEMECFIAILISSGDYQ